MRKLVITIVSIAFVALGTRSGVVSSVRANDVVSPAPRVQIAQTRPAPLAHSSLSHVTHAPLHTIVTLAPAVPEPAVLFLLGSGLISVGLLFRRWIRS